MFFDLMEPSAVLPVQVNYDASQAHHDSLVMQGTSLSPEATDPGWTPPPPR